MVIKEGSEKKLIQPLHLPHLGILLTTYCNLNCRNCADLIPKRKNMHYDKEQLKSDLLQVLNVVESIEEVLLIGGETFMYPWLEEIIEFCGKLDKVRKIIITTNGTFQPKELLLNCIKNNNVIIRISGYPDFVVPFREKVVSTYKNNNIIVEDFKNMTWLDIGKNHKRNRTVEEQKQVFSSCNMKSCVTMNGEGKIFYCSRQMSAYETEIYPNPNENEFVDVRNSEKIKENFEKFYELSYISTCDYCDGISCETTRVVPTAIQILDKNIFLELLFLCISWKEKMILDSDAVSQAEKILTLYHQYLRGLSSYEKIEVLCKKFKNKYEKRVFDNTFMQLLKDMVNELSDDYNYYVDETVCYGKRSNVNIQGWNNVIFVSGTKNEQADIIISEEEIFQAMNQKYPIDAFLYNRLYVESKLEKLHKRNVQCIVSGLSYTQYGILEKNMGIETVNLSVTGQDIYHSIMMVKKALKVNENVSNIIIPMTYYHAAYDMASDDAELHKLVMKRINNPILYGEDDLLEIENGDSWNIYSIISELKELKDERNRQFKESLMEKEYFNEMYSCPTYGGLKFDFHQLNLEEKRKSAQITADLNERICCREGFEKTYMELNNFLEDTQDKNILFFVPPMTTHLYDSYHIGLKRFYYDTIVPLFEKYQNVKFMDLAIDERFLDEDFCDFEHLNFFGAKKMTEIIRKEFLES